MATLRSWLRDLLSSSTGLQARLCQSMAQTCRPAFGEVLPHTVHGSRPWSLILIQYAHVGNQSSQETGEHTQRLQSTPLHPELPGTLAWVGSFSNVVSSCLKLSYYKPGEHAPQICAARPSPPSMLKHQVLEVWKLEGSAVLRGSSDACALKAGFRDCESPYSRFSRSPRLCPD